MIRVNACLCDHCHDGMLVDDIHTLYLYLSAHDVVLGNAVPVYPKITITEFFRQKKAVFDRARYTLWKYALLEYGISVGFSPDITEGYVLLVAGNVLPENDLTRYAIDDTEVYGKFRIQFLLAHSLVIMATEAQPSFDHGKVNFRLYLITMESLFCSRNLHDHAMRILPCIGRTQGGSDSEAR